MVEEADLSMHWSFKSLGASGYVHKRCPAQEGWRQVGRRNRGAGDDSGGTALESCRGREIDAVVREWKCDTKWC